MKLLIAQSNLTLYGGAERVLLKIAQHYDAKIYTAEYNKKTTFPEFGELEIEIIGSGAFTKMLPYGRVAQGLNYGLSFYNFKIKEDYDVINAHMSPSQWIRNKNERVIWYCHTPPRDVYDLYKYRLSLKNKYTRPLYAMGLKTVKMLDQKVVQKLDFIFANSTNTKTRIEKYYNRKDAYVLGGGIDYRMYKNGGSEKFFFYPSRFSPNKRQEYAIKAFEIFKRKSKGYKLVLCGSVSKDKQFQDYYTKIKELAASVGDVKLISNARDNEVKDLFSRATAVLYTPINEDYGLVPMESMASGKPVIAVNEGGPADTIKDGKTGFLVNSEKEMAEKMQLLCEHQSIAEEIGKNGIREVKANYSWERFFEVFDKKARKIAKSAT